jgi:hypothetical protein
MWLGDRLYKFATLDEMQQHLAYMERNLDTARRRGRATRRRTKDSDDGAAASRPRGWIARSAPSRRSGS